MKTKVIEALFGDSIEVEADDEGDVRLRLCEASRRESSVYFSPDTATELIKVLKKARRAARKVGA